MVGFDRIIGLCRPGREGQFCKSFVYDFFSVIKVRTTLKVSN